VAATRHCARLRQFTGQNRQVWR